MLRALGAEGRLAYLAHASVVALVHLAVVHLHFAVGAREAEGARAGVGAFARVGACPAVLTGAVVCAVVEIYNRGRHSA